LMHGEENVTRPLDELLEKALEIPKGPERQAWVKGLCLDNPSLEAELRDLIEAHESAGEFLRLTETRRRIEEATDG
jgi:hypothetical protein